MLGLRDMTHRMGWCLKTNGTGLIRMISVRVFASFKYVSYTAGSVLLIICIGNILLGAAFRVYDRARHRAPQKNDESELTSLQRYCRRVVAYPPLREYPWALECAEEQAHSFTVQYEPYVVWRRKACDGRHTNVESNGIRRTVGSSHVSGAERVVLFGGSTVWGSWVSDRYTIPSWMQALSDRYILVNHGEKGYNSVQGLNALLDQLAQGNVPDVVVFYDGYNDSYAGVYSPSLPRAHQNLDIIRNKFESTAASADVSLPKFLLTYMGEKTSYGRVIRKVTHRSPDKPEKRYEREHVLPFVPDRTKTTIALYEAVIRQVKALAKEYGFKCAFVWQPNLLQGTRDMLPYEKEIYASESPILRHVMESCYQEAKNRLDGRQSEGIFFLGNALDETDFPMYVDPCHLGPEGNRIMAEEILKILDRLSDQEGSHSEAEQQVESWET